MVVIPRQKPDVANLNSYYVDIDRLIEHYQGVMGTGCVHFVSGDAEGAVYFEPDEILNSVFQAQDRRLSGPVGLDAILRAARQQNFTIGVFHLSSREIYLWAGMAEAEILYENLSAAFTDPAALIRKMQKEALTGYIAADIGHRKERGLLFFNKGQIIGGSFSWVAGTVADPDRAQDILIRKIGASGGTFHVGRVSPAGEKPAAPETTAPAPAEPEPAAAVPDAFTLTALESLLAGAERMVTDERRIKAEFGALLKKQFVRIADQFEFLDPFAAEFTYADRKITFVGEADEGQLIRGVVTALRGVGAEIGLEERITALLTAWLHQQRKKRPGFGPDL